MASRFSIRGIVLLACVAWLSLAAARPAAAVNVGMQFLGNDFVYIPPSPSLDLTGNITVSAWIKWSGSGAQQQIFWRGDTQGGLDPYALMINDDGKVQFEVDLSNSNYYKLTSTAPVDTEFHYWSGVYDASNSKIYLYRDGVLQTSADTTGTYAYDTSGMWNLIGAVDNGNWQFFQGIVDEINVWNVVRTPPQLAQDMRGTLTGSETGLAGLWRFGDAAEADIAEDSSPNHNDGRLGTSPDPDDANPTWILVPDLPPVLPPPDLQAGLVSWWPGNGNALDAIGSNDGQLLNGAGYASDFVTQVFAFDGDQAYFDAPTDNLPTDAGDRTLALWVKARSFNENESFFAGYGNFGSLRQVFALGASQTPTGQRLFFSQWGTGFSGPVLEPALWYHVAVTQVSGHQTLYVNGAPVAEGNFPVETPAGTRINIGRVAGSLGEIRKLDGLISDVRVYNRGIAASDVQALFEIGVETHPNTAVLVKEPNGGESLAAGSWIQAAWQSDLQRAGSAVNFELWDGSGKVAFLGPGWDPSGEGSTPLYLPLVPERADYRIVIQSSWDPTLTDTSDAPFTITGGPVRVGSPNGGEVWTVGTLQAVHWSTGVPFAGTALSLELWNTQGKVADLGQVWNASGDGLNWPLVPLVVNGNDYWIKAISLWNANYSDMSDAPFTIVGGTDPNDNPRNPVESIAWTLYR